MAVAADRLLVAGLVIHAGKAAGRGEEGTVLKGRELNLTEAEKGHCQSDIGVFSLGGSQ